MVDIALALSFSSQANFTRAFTKATGQAPGQFQGRNGVGANAMRSGLGRKTPESIVEDFDSIRQYLNRLQNERARSLSTPVVVTEKRKPEDSASISNFWISGKI